MNTICEHCKQKIYFNPESWNYITKRDGRWFHSFSQNALCRVGHTDWPQDDDISMAEPLIKDILVPHGKNK